MRDIIDCAEGRKPWPLLMYGPPGTGKTCAALCLLDRVYAGRMYVTTRDLTRLVCNEYRCSLPEFHSDWEKANVTVIDELGS
ncbi:MAG: AAA family ATPase, partial [Rhodospirillales bacterium]|nr:AAA family ATPase [Rhodospirillales bacterium]